MTSSLRTADGQHYLCAEEDGKVVADRTAPGPWEHWEVLEDPFGDASVRVLQSSHGSYLSAYSRDYCLSMDLPPNSVGATAEYADAWERWRVWPGGDTITLQSCFTGLWLSPQQGGGGAVLCDGPAPAGWEVLTPSALGAFVPGVPPPGGANRPLSGLVRLIGHSFGDTSGPRLLHGGSDFCALAKHHEDRDKSLRQLDVVAQHQQYLRVGWRVNGWLFAPAGLSVDPTRDAWFDDTLRNYLEECRDRNIRVNLSSFDMYNWSDQQAEECFRRVASIARSVSPEVVWLSAVINEMRGTMPEGETAANIAKCAHLLDLWQAIYPWSQRAVSDPGSQDKTGMQRLTPTPATVSLIHDVRHSAADAIRHAFNTRQENYPGFPIVQDEPTGENGSVPKPYGQNVYAPIQDSDEILGIYTAQVMTGQAATYFSDPSLVSREPLEATWGFTNLPRLWQAMGIPDDIGQGTPVAGHAPNAPLRVINSHASRADSMVLGDYRIGVISGSWDGQPWAVRAGLEATFSVWYADGKSWEGRLSEGQVIPTRTNFQPAVVLALT